MIVCFLYLSRWRGENARKRPGPIMEKSSSLLCFYFIIAGLHRQPFCSFKIKPKSKGYFAFAQWAKILISFPKEAEEPPLFPPQHLERRLWGTSPGVLLHTDTQPHTLVALLSAVKGKFIMMPIIKHLRKPTLNEFPVPGLYLSTQDLQKREYLAQWLQLPAKSGALLDINLFRKRPILERLWEIIIIIFVSSS